jgi:purine-binding chemotaxis protein CheW
MSDELPLLTVVAAGTPLLVEASRLLEVVPRAEVTHVPALPEWMAGVANLRGVVLTVMDLAPRLALGQAVLTERSCLLVIEGESGRAHTALGVDRVGKLYLSELGAIEPLPPAGVPVPAAFCLGMSRVTGQVLPVIDPARLLRSAEES